MDLMGMGGVSVGAIISHLTALYAFGKHANPRK